MDSNTPLVSIAIPCYNYGEYVLSAVKSAFAQTYANKEIFIIDPESSDGVTQRLLQHFPYDITVHKEPNRGLSETRNHGMRLAQGKYCMFLDADDIIKPDYVARCVALLEADAGLGCAYSWTKAFGDTNVTWPTSDLDMKVLRERNQAPSHSMIRRVAWEDVVRLNSAGWISKYDGFFEDWVFWIDLVRAGWRGRVIPEPLILHREHANNLMKTPARAAGLARMHGELRKDRPDIYAAAPVPSPAFLVPEYTGNTKNILLMLSGLTCGGTERGVLLKVRELVSHGFSVHILTTGSEPHVWESKFRQITPRITHMPTKIVTDEYRRRVLQFVRANNIGQIMGIQTSVFYDCVHALRTAYPLLPIYDALHTGPGFGHHAQSVAHDKEITKHVVITNTHAKTMIASGINPDKLLVVYNGIDVSTLRPEAKPPLFPAQPLHVLYLGRLSEEKRPEDFVELAYSFRDIKPLRFTMAGDGPFRPMVAGMIAQRRLQNIGITGYVEPAQVLYSADILVMPSLLEGFPLACLEAIASGVYVLATNVGETAKILQESWRGRIIPKIGDVPAFKAEILKIINDHALLTRVRAEGRAWVSENYAHTRMVNSYLKIFSGDAAAITELTYRA